MIDPTRTTTAMLEGLFDPTDDDVWSSFDARYRPIVEGFARRIGLSEADAADAAQETMARFLQEYRAGKYDRSRSRLRSWLIGIARYRALDIQRWRAGRREHRGESVVDVVSDEAHLSTLWEEERRQVLLRRAMDELKKTGRTSDKTTQAFELLMFQQMSPGDVAEALGMTTRDVYMAKSRIAERLRTIVTRLDAEYDGEN